MVAISLAPGRPRRTLAAEDAYSNKTLVRETVINPSNGGSKRSIQSDEELLIRYRERGERPAFAELVHRYERELYSYLRRFLGNAEMAEDAFQATFLQVHLKGDQFEKGRKFRPWLYSIATNQAIDLQRRNKRHKMVSLDGASQGRDTDLASLLNLLSTEEPGPVSRLVVEEQREWIRGAVAGLPETLRSVVALVYYQGMKYREAAEVLGIPVGTVKSRLHSALLRLNEAWQHSEASRG